MNNICYRDYSKRKYSSMFFIDRVNYNNLIDASFNVEDIPNLIIKGNDNVSNLTRYSLVQLNKKLIKLFCNSDLSDGYYDNLINVSNKEKQYVEDNFKTYMFDDNKAHLVIYYNDDKENKKYYDIKVLSDNMLLIIVEEGFLKFITESKDNLLEIILDCLCYHYKYDFSMFSLLKTYIRLKINDSYFNLIKSCYL